MKSFFKKLAFVMALAMVVSLAAPAAKTAVAAEEKDLAIAYQAGMAITEVNLANIGDFEDLRFLYAPENWKELGVNWSSSNENVVTVDESGIVTAVAAGSAIVTVAIGTESASVVVNVVDLPTYEVTIGIPAEELRNVTEKTLEIGDSVDFAFYGIKDYSRDKIGTLPRYLCTWQSDDTTVLTKDDDAGNFTAVAAGTAKVTLTVANVMTGQTHNVIPVKVTVNAPAVEEVTKDIVAEINKTQNTFEITFDKATELKDESVEVFRVFFADDDNNGDGVIDERDLDYAYENFYVDTVTTDDDKLVYTVKTHDDFTDGVTYEVRVAGYEAERFVASVGEVAKVVVKKTKTPTLASDDRPLVAGAVDVKLYDAKGVDVTTRVVDGVKNNDDSNISYWLVEESDAYSLGYNDIEFYEMATAKVMATFENANVKVDSAEPAIITPEKYKEYGVAEVVAWTLVAPGGKADWTKLVKEVPAGETDYIIATLLKDTRDQYFTTHEASATVNGGQKYNDEPVHWTENEDEDFWVNGLYVKYRAMNPDKMLVEDYGEVASYEVGKARFALYLYDYNLYNDQFVEELYSQYVNVCHPMKMTDAKSADTNVSIMMNTKNEYGNRDAYYGKFSKTSVLVTLYDIHGGTAKADQAAEADFEVTLLSKQLKNESDASFKILEDKVAEYDAMLDQYVDTNWDGKVEEWSRKISIEANDFDGMTTDRTQVKLQIKENVTGKKIVVTINLKKLVWTEIDKLYQSQIALVKEFVDQMRTDKYFQKFKVDAANSVTQYIYDGDKDEEEVDNQKYGRNYTGYWTIKLPQTDKNNNTIGFEDKYNLFYANTLNPKNAFTDVFDVDGTALWAGDRVLTIKAPNGKAYPVLGTDVANPNHNKKLNDTAGETVATTNALGVTIEVVDETTAAPATFGAVGVDGEKTPIYGYRFYFRAVDPTTKELIFAKDGKYTATIQTVEWVDYNYYVFEKADKLTGDYILDADGYYRYVVDKANLAEGTATYKIKVKDNELVKNDNYGKIYFTSSTNLKTTTTVTVTNDNPEVQLKKRVLTRIDAYLDYLVDTSTNIDNNPVMCQYILDAFDFKFDNGSTWTEGGKVSELSYDDILYYTYTVTPTNNQIVINSVTFKVPVLDRNDNGSVYDETGTWYRSTAIVNKSLTFNEY